jgi:hypothetical protein
MIWSMFESTNLTIDAWVSIALSSPFSLVGLKLVERTLSGWMVARASRPRRGLRLARRGAARGGRRGERREGVGARGCARGSAPVGARGWTGGVKRGVESPGVAGWLRTAGGRGGRREGFDGGKEASTMPRTFLARAFASGLRR